MSSGGDGGDSGSGGDAAEIPCIVEGCDETFTSRLVLAAHAAGHIDDADSGGGSGVPSWLFVCHDGACARSFSSGARLAAHALEHAWGGGVAVEGAALRAMQVGGVASRDAVCGVILCGVVSAHPRRDVRHVLTWRGVM